MKNPQALLFLVFAAHLISGAGPALMASDARLLEGKSPIDEPYDTRSTLVDERTGQKHDWSKRHSDVIKSQIIGPVMTPRQLAVGAEWRKSDTTRMWEEPWMSPCRMS